MQDTIHNQNDQILDNIDYRPRPKLKCIVAWVVGVNVQGHE